MSAARVALWSLLALLVGIQGVHLALLAQAGLGGLLPFLGVPTLQMLNPSVSLFGLRVAIPFLLVAAVAFLRPSLSGTRGWTAAGAASALGALFAPDSGATTLGGLAVFLLGPIALT